MSALDIATKLVIQFEGFRSHPYQDVAGVWTIGYGTIRTDDGSPVTADTPPVTEDQAEAMMMRELTPTAGRVDLLVPPDATDNQRAACYSFAYNEGVGSFSGSTLLRVWKAGDVEAAAAQFDIWIMAGGRVVQGLINRRAAERACFETP